MSDWSLFEIDGAVWNESGESDDHIVPDPKDAWEGTCMVKGEPKKKFCLTEKKSVGNKNVCLTEKGDTSSSITEEPSAQLLDMDSWCDLHCEKQSATYNLMHVNAEMANKSADSKTYKDIKQESTENDLIIGICKEDPMLENGDSIIEDRDDSLVSNFCHFSLSDICPPEGDLEFFGNEHEDEESCTLLDYGWENIGNFEDVDRLLRSCESTFGHSVNSGVDELVWPSSSSACFDNSFQGNVQQGRASSSPESRALKGKSQQNEQKMEFMPCDYPSLATCQIDGSKGLDYQKNNSISITDKHLRHESSRNIQELQQNVVNDNKCSCEEQQQVGHTWRSEGTMISQKENGDNCQDIDKVSSYRKQVMGNKQPEKKHKKHLSDKKTTQNMPSVITYSSGFQVQHNIFPRWQTSASSAVQIFPSPVHASQKNLVETGSLRQFYPQFPYIHAGYGYPLHHVPAMPYLSNLRPQAEQGNPLFVGCQIPTDISNQPHQISKPAVIPSRPSSMTPQEKIEKLRWRQQMQARLAVEHQHQELDSQKTCTNHSPVHKQPQNIHCQQVEVKPMEGLTKVLQSTNTDSDSLAPHENSRAVSELTYSDSDGSLEANVLHQLQNVIARLGMKKRLCIRDSLYRLARSAMQRRFVGDTKSSGENSEHIEAVGICTSIDIDQTQSDRCLGPNDIETETNPFDRTIAHLLFHKNSMPSAGLMTAAADSSNSTFSTNSQSFSATPNFWLSQPPEFELLTEVQVVPATNLHLPISGQSPTSIVNNGIGCCTQNMINRNGSSPGCSSIVSDVLFDPQICGSPASMDVENSEGILVSKHQGVPHNNDSNCPSVKCNQKSERGAIIDNNEGLIELRCHHQHLPEVKEESNIFPSSTQNITKKESIESPDVDMLDKDSDAVDVMDTNSELMTSEQFSEIRGSKKHRLSR
ncbi:uncharacterized protein LOC131038234 isoform X1 [Cryptomeria japonica]|uniref:uncharacterized protein LOC131038234 isoform X1 n=2 Tax=Cryptomeria japonica TaxID=3369 RepID=UPI0027DA2819|nr:uncharacterized protein LOC131038234 isoform X1 [Cryptomeria japonica]